MDELSSRLWPEQRYYMVGKLVRRDNKAPEPGFRAALRCLCHNEPVVVVGPRHISPRYMALCSVVIADDLESALAGVTANHVSSWIGEAGTVETLWERVETGDQTQER